jgi:hypothetical protein
MHEMIRVIAEVEPIRPSDVVATLEPASGRDQTPITPEIVSAAREGDPNRLRKRLAGDLDSILLMALRKEPERRYGSVESFAEDLKRHLEQRPVNAREATPWERFLRFRRRNPGPFAAGVVVAILFLTALAAVAWQGRRDIQAAQLNPAFAPFFTPFWLFSSGIAMCALCAAVYFARARAAQRLGAAAGGLVWGLGLMGRWWLENDMGWWRSRIAGHTDPLMLFSALTFSTLAFMAAALLLVLTIIGRRFGWRGQVLSLAVLGLYQAARERVWFGEFIPALTFQPGVIPVLGGAGMLIASGATALLVMRLIGGPDAAGIKRK